jgi:L-threonylcarbamoyladenylate synthase
MRVIAVDPTSPEQSVIEEAAEILRAGGLVAFPTETVYGLAANALDAAAVERIYSAKGRPSFNPLIVHVPDENGARALASVWPDRAARVAKEFWPGPLTIVLPKREKVPDNVTAGLDSVALRVPANPIALALLRAADTPLAAPSANRSTELSPTTARHVERSLGERVDLILDGGPTSVGIESTVLDLRSTRATLLRPGLIGAQELEAFVGPIVIPNEVDDEGARPSPGMMERHYAPRAEVVLFETEDAGRIFDEARRLAEHGRVGMLLRTVQNTGESQVIRMPTDPPGYARRLYAALHELDERGCSVVYVERPPNGSEWMGVRDRLDRASHP